MRALIPTAENKAAVWERLINDDGMANALQDAAIAGFSHPAQAHCWSRSSRSTSQVVAQVWDRRSIEVAQKVAVGLFPRWAIAQSTVDRALAWDGRGDHPTALAGWCPRAGPESSGPCGLERPTPADGGRHRLTRTNPRANAGRPRALLGGGLAWRVGEQLTRWSAPAGCRPDRPGCECR